MKHLIRELEEMELEILSGCNIKGLTEEKIIRLDKSVSMYTIRTKRIEQLKELISKNGSMLEDKKMLKKSEIKERIGELTKSVKDLEREILRLIKVGSQRG